MSSSSNQIKVGAILSYVSLLLTNVAAILVTPYMLRSLGKSEYGLYMLIGAFVSYLAVLDFGLSTSLVRYVARYRAIDDKEGEQNLLSIAMVAYICISLVALIIGWVLYWNLDIIFKTSFTAIEMSKAKIMFAILIFNLIVALPGGAFNAVVTAYERFAFSKSIDLIRFLLRTSLLVTLLYFGYKAITMVILDTAMNLLVILLNIIYVFFNLRIRFIFHRFDKEVIREFLIYSFWIFCIFVMYQLYQVVGQIFLGITEGTASVAVFSISVIFVGYYGSFAYIFSSLLLPHATKIVALGATSAELTDLMIKVGRIQYFIASYVLGGFILFGFQFIHLWAGKDYSASWLIALIIIVPNTVTMARNVGESILQALNRNVIRAVYFFMMVACSVAVGLIARNYINGPMAMGIGMMTASIIGNVFMTFYYAYVIKINMMLFYKDVFLIQSIILAVIIGCGGLMIYYFPVTGWITLAIEASIYSLLFIIATWYSGTNSYEKELINQTRTSLIMRIKSAPIINV